MSPIGRPSPDGDGIVAASRFGKASGDGLGPAGPWKCPACMLQNEGRIEQGCVHCGSGDPTKSRAGTPRMTDPDPPRPDAVPRATRAPAPSPELADAAGRDLSHRAREAAGVPTQRQRVLRIIEYLIKPDANADDVLRNSLVGRMEFAWGSLTGVLVDSADLRQEDLLGLARRQPGVWLANPNAMVLQAAISQSTVPNYLETTHVKRLLDVDTGTRPPMTQPLPPAEVPGTITPDTGLEFTTHDKDLAWKLIELGGYTLAHTIALALGTIAEELESNADPERLLSREAALRLASAIMFLIPDEWLTPTTPPPSPVDPAQQAAINRVRDGSKPVASPWVDPTAPGATKL